MANPQRHSSESIGTHCLWKAGRAPGSAIRPIVDTQPWHSIELLVGTNESQPVCPGNGSDLEVVRTNDPALKLQVVPDLGIMLGGRIVERERCEGRKEQMQRAPPPLAVAIFLGTMPQFRLDHSAEENVRYRVRPKLSFKFPTGILQQGNPDVRVRQEGHYHASRFSDSPWGGRSNGSPPNSAAMRAKKSGGKRGDGMEPFWVSTSSKASRTNFSSDDAALASSVFNFASSSSAMADMSLSYRPKAVLARGTSGSTAKKPRMIQMAAWLFAAALLLSDATTSAAVHYVDASSTNAAPPYTNWTTAATNIQDAVDAALAGDEIVVTNGTYATGGRSLGGDITTNRVVVDKPLILRSLNGPQFTMIEG